MNRRATIPYPTPAKVAQLAAAAGFELDEKEIQDMTDVMESTIPAYTRIYDLPEQKLPVKYARDLGSIYKPFPKDNPYNAWAYCMSIKGATSGKLENKTVAIKDNVQIAGVTMTNGSELIRGFVPTEDAVIVTKILDAGGHIVGTSNVEDMCISGTSNTGLNGPVLNPIDKTRTSGGSSSGSGTLVALGEVDMAIGCDQGGSIRIPSSWCGIVGLKPTFGLVSYSGIIPIETTIDHVGPMAKTVSDCALMLEVLAGSDGGLDPRQPRDLVPQEYTRLMTQSLSGKKVGYVKEAFEHCEPDVNSVVMESLKYFEAAGIQVEEVSIPMHSDGETIWSAPCFEGTAEVMLNGNAVQYGMKGYKNTALIDHLHKSMQSRTNYMSQPLKLAYLWAQYVKETCGPSYYARSMNLERTLRKAYDDMLDNYDVLLMPTLPYVAPKLPEKELPLKEAIKFSFGMVKNLAPFNLTGHPALSINAGFSEEKLPIGLMIVGKHFDDATVLAYGHTFEQKRDGK